MSVPLIGVTGMWSNRVHGLRFDGSVVAVQVLRSIVRAGGEPLMLFAESDLSAAERVRRFDGIVVPGGADVNPSFYGVDPHPKSAPADHEGQDKFEAEIMDAAIAEGVPLLAICRGFQLLNVARGGDLDQHIGDESNPHRNGVHAVDISPSSKLRGILGADRISVSSYHHQAVQVVGDGLVVSAIAPDGVVEGLETADGPAVAIQWHPEDGAEKDPQQQAVFDWLVTNARVRQQIAVG